MDGRLKEAVKQTYGQVAASGLSSEVEGARLIAEAFGYTPADLAGIPAEANMGLSCGNPTALASLKPGETVVDLGSGGGLDVFLASRLVGPAGRAIGIDMTEQMITRARRNAASAGYTNVEFHLAEIERLPLADGTADCVMSNCVLNLVPDKRRAFAEIFRVLRPGGRLAASDIALKQTLPTELASDLMAYVGCIAGAVLIDEYQALLRDAGFEPIHVVDAKADLNAYAQLDSQAGCCSPTMSLGEMVVLTDRCGANSDGGELHHSLAALLERHNVNDYAASVQVYAVKPSR